VSTVVGLDGCRGGWFGARLGEDGSVEGFVLAQLDDLGRGDAVIAIDIPVGLEDTARPGGRLCDAMARRLLGPTRAASVFSPPSRAALAAGDHAEACRLNPGPDGSGPGLTIQCWNIVPKIREADAFVRTRRRPGFRLHEVHPEVTFHVLNGNAPLAFAKKTAEGRRERLALLAGAGIPEPEALIEAHRGPLVAADDIVDALAAAVSARRALQGRAIRLPQGEPPYDALGIPMFVTA
jgi:predicted RNase H-like nuclease